MSKLLPTRRRSRLGPTRYYPRCKGIDRGGCDVRLGDNRIAAGVFICERCSGLVLLRLQGVLR